MTKSNAKNAFLGCESRWDLAVMLGMDVSSLTYFAYGNGKKYKKFFIPKKGGGQREILAPVDALMSVQRNLAELLNSMYPAPSYVYGFVDERNTLENATRHLGKRAVLNFDLKDFFPSITSGRLIGLLKAAPFNFNNEVASTLVGLMCHEGKLPQGAPTSPVMSNIICFRLDRALFNLAKREHATYSRYADDITFSTRGKFRPAILKNIGKPPELGDELKSIIAANYFEVNDAKTRLSFGTKAKYVTGLKVNTIPNVPRTYVKKIRGMLHAWERHGLAAAQNEFSQKYGGGKKDFILVLQGKISYLKHIKGENDLMYRRLYNRFVAAEGKNRTTLPENEIEELYNKVFVMESGKMQGTGFVIDQKFLVTCNHLIEQEEIQYFTYNEFPHATRRRARVDRKYASEKFDIAITAPQKSDCVPARSFTMCVARDAVVVGEDYRIIGFRNYVAGQRPHVTPVVVTKMERDKHGVLNAFIDKKLIGGDSGSPVINARNELVGIVLRGTHSLQTGDDWTGYVFLPVEEIRRFFTGHGVSS